MRPHEENEEHKHVGETALAYPTAQRLQTYFPVFPLVTGTPLYALRQLQPAGSPRDIDRDFMLEIMRVRYQFTLVMLPAYHTANELDAEGIEHHVSEETLRAMARFLARKVM